MEEEVLKIKGTELVRCLDKNVESVTIPDYGHENRRGCVQILQIA